jgi:glyoxylase-like metal-dependent hydrolase (beta-lactamase superfamily II)
MLAEIAKITPKPVTTVILTHSDGDHTNGLPAFPKGVKIIAHENNKKEQQAVRNPLPPEYLPSQLITKEKESLKIDGVNLTLIHVMQAHTSGDLAIYLPDQKIVFTGDLITSDRPDVLIHAEKNGSSEGWLRFVKALTDLDADSYVAGHGALQTKSEVQKKLAETEQKRAKIKSLVAEGKSLDDVKAALGETNLPVPVGRPNFPSFADVVYQELAKK